jgi:hypothetical protein
MFGVEPSVYVGTMDSVPIRKTRSAEFPHPRSGARLPDGAAQPHGGAWLGKGDLRVVRFSNSMLPLGSPLGKACPAVIRIGTLSNGLEAHTSISEGRT